MQLRYHTLILHFLFLLYFTCLSRSINVLQRQNVRHQQVLNQVNNNEDLMIIGARGYWGIFSKHIAIRDRAGNLKWSWYLDMAQEKDIPKKVKSCIHSLDSITEIKRAAGGDKVVAIVGDAIIVFDMPSSANGFLPKVRFASCVNSSHTAELLPDDFLALATSGNTQSDGLYIFDLRTSAPTVDVPDPRPVQIINGFPAVHGLLWDEAATKLWAVGNDRAPEGDKPSQGLLRGFNFAPNSDRTTVLHPSKEDEFLIGEPTRLTTEWGSNTKWWNGPHNLVGIPHTRKVLVTTDLSVFGIDLGSRGFLAESEVDKILAGFEPIGNRHGLPRSDIKSLSINGQGQTLYVQANWGEYFSKDVMVIEGNGEVSKVNVGSVYKARWFTEIPGWPTA
ncbi:hypothetical protein FSST1_006747 [Fusarium sambucinum]